MNSLAVLAAATLAGADLAERGAGSSPGLAPPTGRGARQRARACRAAQRAADRRVLQRQPGLHAGGHRAARPGADRGARPPHRRAGRDAGTRTAAARNCTAAWPSRSSRTALTSCTAPDRFTSGLWGGSSLQPQGRLARRERRALEPQVLGAVHAGDAVMIKGSLGLQDGPHRQGADPLSPVARRFAKRRPLRANKRECWSEAARLIRCSGGWADSSSTLSSSTSSVT